jgi:phospholipid/cholesterol/gamma-HCH transport system ATP-binding protein
MVRLKQVYKTLGRQKVLQGVDLEVHKGERLVIIGRSGGGKSVLLRHINGLLRPDRGEVWFHEYNFAAMTEEQITPLRRDMGMLFQNGALFDSLTVFENVAFPLREAGKLSNPEIKTEVEKALKIVDLPGQGSKWPAELSGGMKKRVALARAAISRPELMLFDEPTAGLDPIVSDSINKLILRLGEELNMTAVIVTHDMVSAFQLANRVAMLHEGKIYSVDAPERIRDSQDPVIQRFVKGISDGSDAVF